MEIQVNIEELKKHKLFIATPMYGGMAHGLYIKSCLDLQTTFNQYGIETKFSFLFNESLITRARNYLVDEFLRSDYTHMMFIDSDIHFSPKDVIALLALDKDVIGGPYPKKSINWGNVAHAARNHPDLEPRELENLVGEYVFNVVKGTSSFQVSEPLTKELNYNFSSNHSVNIVFTDLDEYGFKLIVNKQVFEEEIAWVYSGIGPDMVRTIDRTLRTWLTRNYINLQKLGIIADLQYIGSFTSPFYNSIKLHTEYPNVEMYVNDVKVGTTANYYIEHSKVLFNDMGSYLSLEINSDTYDQSTIYLTGTYSQYPNIPATLQAWVDEHGSYLANYGILVTNIHNLLKFDVKKLDRRLDYTITTGKSSLPGMSDYIITKKIKGNNGVVITSNEVRLPDSASGTYSFEDAGFATGMAFSINNTFHTWNNTEFNVQFLDPEVMNLSYQGPFWGTKDPTCNSSAFITLAFEIGFGQTACDPIIGPTGGSSGGPFNLQQFSSAFSLAYNPNVYTTNTYNLQQYNGTNNLVDISYVQLSNAIYAFGDEVIVMDAFLTDYLTNIPLPGNTQSKKMEFNPVNNYLYCVSNKINSQFSNVFVAPCNTNISAPWTSNFINSGLFNLYGCNNESKVIISTCLVSNWSPV
jgi:hypothetical protein